MRGSRMTDANDVVWEDGGGAHRSRLRGAAPAGRPDMHRPVPSRPTRDDDRRASRPPRDRGTRDDDRTAFELVIESPAASNDKENARPTRNEDDDSRGRRRDGRDDADDASARKALLLRSANDASMRRIGSLHKDDLSLRRVESDAGLTRGSGGSALEAGAFASDSTKREGKLWERDDDDATEGKKTKKTITKKRSFHEKGAADGGALVAGADWGDETKYSARPKEAQTWGAFIASGGVMERDSEFLRSWDLVTATLLVFVAVVTPFELGFMETDVESVNGLVLFSVNRLVDLVFFVDILMQMNTSCVDGAGRVVFARRKIFKEYAKGWLWIDLASIFPFELTIVILTGFKNPDPEQQRLKAVRFLRLLRLLKLLRILRGSRIFQRWETRVTLNYAVLSLQKYLAVCLFAAHWIGCSLMLTHQLLAPDCDDEDIATDNCTFLYAYMGDARMVDVSMWNKYALAMYFSTGELMGTPYGDVTPVRSEERVFFILCHLTAGFINAYLVGGMVAAMAAMNQKDERFHQAMDTLNRFLLEKRLTARNPRLCERLRAYYIFKHRVGGDAWGDVVKHTSREMQGEVVQELHGDWLSRVHYFHGVDRLGVKWEVDDAFKLHLSLHVTLVVAAPLEAIFTEDSPVDALYVVQQGLVGCQNRILRKGDPFGEDVFVYYGCGDLPSEAPVRADAEPNETSGSSPEADHARRRRRDKTSPFDSADPARLRVRPDTLTYADGTVFGSHDGAYKTRPVGAGLPRDGDDQLCAHVVRRRRDPRAARAEEVRLREAGGAPQDVPVAGAARDAPGARDDARRSGRADVRRGHARTGCDVRQHGAREHARDPVPLHASAGRAAGRPGGARHAPVPQNLEPAQVSRVGGRAGVQTRARRASAERLGRNEAFPETARRERAGVRGDARGARRNESSGQGVLHPGARHLRAPDCPGEARLQSRARLARHRRRGFRRRRRGGGPEARWRRGGLRDRARGNARHRR